MDVWMYVCVCAGDDVDIDTYIRVDACACYGEAVTQWHSTSSRYDFVLNCVEHQLV